MLFPNDDKDHCRNVSITKLLPRISNDLSLFSYLIFGFKYY